MELEPRRPDGRRVAELDHFTIPHLFPAPRRRVDEIGDAVPVRVQRGHGVVALASVVEDVVLGGDGIAEVAAPVAPDVENLLFGGRAQLVPISRHQHHRVRRVLAFGSGPVFGGQLGRGRDRVLPIAVGVVAIDQAGGIVALDQVERVLSVALAAGRECGAGRRRRGRIIGSVEAGRKAQGSQQDGAAPQTRGHTELLNGGGIER